MKFLALYMAPVEEMDKMMKSSTPEMQKKGMEEWRKWMDEHKENFADAGAPLGKNKRVQDGEVKDVRNEVGGYSIIEAESHDEAAKIFQDSPHFGMKGSYVEILQIVPMSG